MEFCIISPVAGLERYSTLSRTHLLLAHLTNPKYWEFYHERKKAGDFIILDNGAYEGQMSPRRLLDRIRYINPNVVVLPDHLLEDWHKTWHDAQQFLDSFYYEIPNVEWLYIPQAEKGDIVGFIEGLMRALNDERIKWIGLPRALCYAITNDIFMRARVAEQIKKRTHRVKIHAFGMVKGSVEELRLLRSTSCFQSIDSNAPVWRGWCGYLLDQHKSWTEIPCNYDAPLDSINFESCITHNLEVCGVNANVRSGSGDPV